MPDCLFCLFVFCSSKCSSQWENILLLKYSLRHKILQKKNISGAAARPTQKKEQ